MGEVEKEGLPGTPSCLSTEKSHFYVFLYIRNVPRCWLCPGNLMVINACRALNQSNNFATI